MDKYKIAGLIIIGGTIAGYLYIVNKVININNGIPTRSQLKELKLKRDIANNYNEAVKSILTVEEETNEESE